MTIKMRPTDTFRVFLGGEVGGSIKELVNYTLNEGAPHLVEVEMWETPFNGGPHAFLTLDAKSIEVLAATLEAARRILAGTIPAKGVIVRKSGCEDLS